MNKRKENGKYKRTFRISKKNKSWTRWFHQAAEEVLHSLEPLFEKYPKYKENKVLERLVEPERQIMFRVTWVDDKGEIQINKGYRIQFSSTLGPYKVD